MIIEETKPSGKTLVRTWVNGIGDKWIDVHNPKQKISEQETPKEEKEK